MDFLVQEARATMEKYFTIVELGDREVGVVYKNGDIAGVIAPGKRQLYWRGRWRCGSRSTTSPRSSSCRQALAKVLVRAKQPLAAQVAEAVSASRCRIPRWVCSSWMASSSKVLEPGLHAFWKYQRALKIELVDRRVQAMEVAGQEILTRDKVSLRVNLTALWQVLDVVKARAHVTNFVEFVVQGAAVRAARGGG